MKIIGMLLIVLSAAILSRDRGRGADRRLLLFEELLRFIERIRADISRYLKPISEIPSGFKSDLLSELGFLSDFERLGPREAYIGISRHLSDAKEAARVLERLFSSLGQGYAEDEIRLIDESLREFCALVALERERVPRLKRLSLSLSCAGALALIILIA